MADVCVLFVSEDHAVTRELVGAIATQHSVWSADEIAAGDWEVTVRAELKTAQVAVVVVSANVALPRADILYDELRLAKRLKVPILPFRIGEGELPLGAGALSEVVATGATGSLGEPSTDELLKRLRTIVVSQPARKRGDPASRSVAIGDKHLRVPAFIFSASSFETQISPMAAVDLLAALETEVLLVSAYDVWVSHRDRRSFRLLSSLKRAIESRSILVLDSGNYEAARIRAVVPRRCNFRWTRKSFHNTCLLVSPDAAFAFDEIPTRGPVLQMVREIVNGYRNDLRILRRSCRALWPIVHLPRGIKAADVADVAADLVSRVASRTKTKLIAIPERELGDDLRMRIESVARIRAALNALNDPCALHLLGTGNPIAINAFAAAGADSFDGLEWCRTITDYDRGFLFHFRHLNLFENSTARRVRGPVAKEMMSHAESSYELRALALNIDYWQDSMRSIRGLVGSGQSEAIVRSLPFDGPSLFPPTPMSES